MNAHSPDDHRAQLAREHVILLHRWIEAVFTGSADAQTHAALLDSFSADFRLLGPQGRELDMHAVRTLFREQAGQRPQLRITVDQIEVIEAQGSLIACRHRETHSTPDQHSQRASLALLRVDGQRVRWQFLQETALPG
ncbi:MAG: hypothetical protein GAK43_00752 [Stenotrophomonas maltophilia]|nr:MAG: hypothetical protein GAK43_00752 [Stenotrophomonas maltophilia]